MRRRGSSGSGTHTHTDRTRDGERKGIVSQTCSPVHRLQRAPEGQGSYPAALGGPRCKPQQNQETDKAFRRRVCVTSPLCSQFHDPLSLGGLQFPNSSSPSVLQGLLSLGCLHRFRNPSSGPLSQASPCRSMMSQPSTSSSSETKASGQLESSGGEGVLKKRLVKRWNMVSG